MDLCGPWKMRARVETESKVKNKIIVFEKIIFIQIFYLTMIDEASGWPEIMPIY